MDDEKPKFDRKAHMAKMLAIRQAKRAEKKAKEAPEKPEEVENVVDIPLLSKAFKSRDRQMEEQAEAIHQDGRSQGMSEGYDEAIEDSGMFVREQTVPRDDKQFYSKVVFRPPRIDKNKLQDLMLPSIAMSNYPSAPGIHEYFHQINRIAYLDLIPQLQEWAARWELDREHNRHNPEENPEDEVNPYQAPLSRVISMFDADSRSRLSSDMVGLKEVGTERRDIKKQAQGTGADKIKDAVRRD